jgi:hypothetical protein
MKMNKLQLTYSAYTNEQDGVTFAHTGTVEGARRKAVAYAKEAFPAPSYKGYGPKIVVADAATGERLIDQRI